MASSPHGPWSVATRIPAVIYTIPPNSAVYYVTYVRIYNVDSDYVYVGYTPGYLGSYYCSDGVVVFGTGYAYPAWTGTIWIGGPWTFGFGWGWPYWGWPYWGWGYPPWVGPWWVGYPYFYGPYYGPPPPESNAPGTAAPNVYENWGTSTVTSTSPSSYKTPYVAGSTPQGWQPVQPGTTPPDSSAWAPPASSAPGSAGSSNQPGRIEGYSGQPPSSPSDGWGPSTQAPSAPAAAAPPPPPSAGHAGAAGTASPGGGWAPKR